MKRRKEPYIKGMKIWLDDVRPMPDGYDYHAKTAGMAIAMLQSLKVVEISLDHDLGDDEGVGSGYDVACWIEKAAFHGAIPPLVMHVHSANPVGVQNMMKALKNACRFWEVDEKEFLQ